MCCSLLSVWGKLWFTPHYFQSSEVEREACCDRFLVFAARDNLPGLLRRGAVTDGGTGRGHGLNVRNGNGLLIERIQFPVGEVQQS